jgi:hypothetical protein
MDMATPALYGETERFSSWPDVMRACLKKSTEKPSSEPCSAAVCIALGEHDASTIMAAIIKFLFIII